MIGGDAVANADAHTLLFSASNFVTAPLTMKSVPHQVQRDFVPISLVVQAPLSVAISNKLGGTDLEGLVAAAEAQPGKLYSRSAPPAGPGTCAPRGWKPRSA